MTEITRSWQQAIEQALASIAPAWPLDRLVASSPYWGLRQQTFVHAADTLRQVADSRLHLLESEYRQAWQHGEISAAALDGALRENGWSGTRQDWLDTAAVDPVRAPRLLSSFHHDALETQDRPSSDERVIQQVSQFCAAWFDRDQAHWHLHHERGFYAAWHEQMGPLSVASPWRRWIQRRLRQLPDESEAMLMAGLTQLQVPADALQPYLQALLMRNNGWAAWCAYLGWEAGLQGGCDSHLRQLLAIQLAWECLLDDGERTADSAWAAWQHDWVCYQRCRADARALIWQRAHELTLHGPVSVALCRQRRELDSARPALQAVFCIDVRSEPMRRALEESVEGGRTCGYAGFFGLPLALRLPGHAGTQPRLPVLLAPSWEVQSEAASGAASFGQGWQALQRSPLAGFALVEGSGLGKLLALLRHNRPSAAPVDVPELDPWLTSASAARPPEDDLRLEQRAEIAAAVLPAMGLSGGLAPWVLLTGHASHSSNNPQAAALQCGACGGHGGHQHVRLLARWLNDPALRACLAERGQPIPDDTVFLAALHLTHSDDIVLLDTALLKAEVQARLPALQASLQTASARARRRRAAQIGLSDQESDAVLARKMRQKGHDWAETRPEWALAGNALFIAAKRAKTARLDLGGRAFLHEYDWRSDPDGQRLQAVLAAPMVVAHWINMQYFASTVDPRRFGSGNKLLHNVVAGRIGVFEGNSGDLRIGLAWQSVHDGQRLRHAPLRLAACIDAPAELLSAALKAQPTVRQLVENAWLHLYCVHGEQPLRWQAEGGWRHD